MNTLKAFSIAIVLVLVLSFNISCTDGYSRIPEKFYTAEIIKAVKPDKNYTYWAFCQWPQNTIIYSSGKKPNSLKPDPHVVGDIYPGCQPILYVNYIIAEIDGKIIYITKKQDFAKFLGHIDNLEEAVLLATATQNVGIDENNRKGDGYIITDSGYSLHLMHYENCPESRQSVLIKIDKDKGVLQRTKLDIYYKGKDCIVY